MPQLDNPRQEKFAIFVAKGNTQAEAYRKAGYKTASKDQCSANARRLMRNDEVAVRVAELRQKAAEHTGIDVDLLLCELDDAIQVAKNTRQPAAMVGAIMGKARLLGLVVDRAEIETTARRPMREPTELKKMSLDEWQKKFAPKNLLDPLPVKTQEADEGGDA